MEVNIFRYSTFIHYMFSNIQLKQFVLIGLIMGLVVLLGSQLYSFFPGALGALTFYILLRGWFFKLTVVKGWKKWLAALVFLLSCLLVFVLPFGIITMLVLPKVKALSSNPALIASAIGTVTQKVKEVMPQFHISETDVRGLIQKGSASLPGVFGSAMNLLTNLVLCFFLLYFMLVDGRRMERRVQEFLPLKDENTDQIWQATRNMVVSNAIGIPLLALAQAFVAAIGFYIFGVEEALLWAVLTGIFSMIPVIGTAVICGPLCIYLLTTGHVGQGIGLVIYSLAVIGSVDNILRFTILKRLGDVHPIITVLGIIVGVPIFGFMGFIFGPLLISYLLLLFRIYDVEFSPRRTVTRPED